MIALDIGADCILELGQILEAQTFRETIADLDLGRARPSLERHFEGGGLAGEPSGAVIIRERHLNRPAFTGLHAFGLRFEAWEETARTEDDVNIFSRTALEGLAIDLSDKIQRGLVAVFSDSLPFLCRVNAILLGEPGQDLVNVGAGHAGDKPFYFYIPQTADLDLRQHFERDGEGEIGLRCENLLDFLAVPRKIDLGVHGKPQLIVLDNLVIGLVDGFLDNFGHDRASIETLQMRNRDLAWTEAGDTRLGLDLNELPFDSLREIGGR